ncbi:hypothetical protein GCM10009811_20780 [Nostocoides veronense]|uniref:Uncharacterized protein n=1 Tax=Nostocoides veronense TaxID=330836 RepID=A0ABN2LR02_9MICO
MRTTRHALAGAYGVHIDLIAHPQPGGERLVDADDHANPPGREGFGTALASRCGAVVAVRFSSGCAGISCSGAGAGSSRIGLASSCARSRTAYGPGKVTEVA